MGVKITEELLKDLEKKAKATLNAFENDSSHDDFWESIERPTELILAMIERIRELEKK